MNRAPTFKRKLLNIEVTGVSTPTRLTRRQRGRRQHIHDHWHYLVQVDDGESVLLSFSHVSHTEVEPLGMFVSVEVITQVEFIVPPTTVCACVYACVCACVYAFEITEN